MNNFIKEYIDSEKINPKHYKRLLYKTHLLKELKEYLCDKEVNEVGIKEALEYQGWLFEKGKQQDLNYSPSTINEYMTTASNFYDYLKEQNVVFNNPFKSIKRLRLEKKIPRNILNEKEIDKLLNYFRDWNKASNLKDRASLYKLHVICELMYSTGLRVTEVSNLKVEDINLSTGVVEVREGKGGFNRTAILNDYSREVLRIYIDSMREIIFSCRNRANNHLLFGLGESFFERYVNDNLLKASDKLKLKKTTSHGFRHALGYHLLKSGCDIRNIQEILGHKRLRNTEIYTKVDKEDLRKVLNKYHPRIFKRIKDEVNS